MPAAQRALQNSWPRDRSTRVVFVCVCVWRWKISGYFRTRTNKRKPPPFASIFFFASFASFYSKTHATLLLLVVTHLLAAAAHFSQTLWRALLSLTHNKALTMHTHTPNRPRDFQWNCAPHGNGGEETGGDFFYWGGNWAQGLGDMISDQTNTLSEYTSSFLSLAHCGKYGGEEKKRCN